MVHFSEHKIAAGHNAEVDLEFIGELEAGGLQFSEPVGANYGFNPGKIVIRLDGLTSTVGKNKQTFAMGMTFPQYTYIRDTYCGGGYSGKVTVRTRWMDNAWANYNATLILQSEGMDKVWGGYRTVEWTYYDLVELA